MSGRKDAEIARLVGLGLRRAEIAGKCGVTTAAVANRMRVLGLSYTPEQRRAIRSNAGKRGLIYLAQRLEMDADEVPSFEREKALERNSALGSARLLLAIVRGRRLHGPVSDAAIARNVVAALDVLA